MYNPNDADVDIVKPRDIFHKRDVLERIKNGEEIKLNIDAILDVSETLEPILAIQAVRNKSFSIYATFTTNYETVEYLPPIDTMVKINRVIRMLDLDAQVTVRSDMVEEMVNSRFILTYIKHEVEEEKIEEEIQNACNLCLLLLYGKRFG